MFVFVSVFVSACCVNCFWLSLLCVCVCCVVFVDLFVRVCCCCVDVFVVLRVFCLKLLLLFHFVV